MSQLRKEHDDFERFETLQSPGSTLNNLCRVELDSLPAGLSDDNTVPNMLCASGPIYFGEASLVQGPTKNRLLRLRRAGRSFSSHSKSKTPNSGVKREAAWTGAGQGEGQGEGQGSAEWIANQAKAKEPPPPTVASTKAAEVPTPTQAIMSAVSMNSGVSNTKEAPTQGNSSKNQQQLYPQTSVKPFGPAQQTLNNARPTRAEKGESAITLSASLSATSSDQTPLTQKPVVSPTITTSPPSSSTSSQYSLLSPQSASQMLRPTSSRPAAPVATSSSQTQNHKSASLPTSGTIILVIGLFLTLLLSWLVLRKRILHRVTASNPNQEKEIFKYSATARTNRPKHRESPLFGGSSTLPQNGATGRQSWVEGIMDQLSKAEPPSFNNRFSRRGSGWMVLDEDQIGRTPSIPKRVLDPFASHYISEINQSEEKAFRSPDSNGDAHSSSSSTDAVITTASRVSAHHSTTVLKDYNRPSSTTRSPMSAHNHSRHGTESSMTSSQPRYPEEVYHYDTSSSLTHPVMKKIIASEMTGPPGNTMIGASRTTHHPPDRPVPVLRPTPEARLRGAADGFKEGVSGKMARAREPLNVTNKKRGLGLGLGVGIGPGGRKPSLTYTHARVPSRAYHSSFTVSDIKEEDADDEGSAVQPLPGGKRVLRVTNGWEREDSQSTIASVSSVANGEAKRDTRALAAAAGIISPSILQSPSSTYPESAARNTFRPLTLAMESVGSMMLTDYDSGGIMPAHIESPPMSGIDLLGENGDRNIQHKRSTGPRRQSSAQPLPKIPATTASTYRTPPITSDQQLRKEASEATRTNEIHSAPRLTLTSPSSRHIHRLSFSHTSSGEETFMPLSQIALANMQPNYKSPTYSIYNMYDGDDESGNGITL